MLKVTSGMLASRHQTLNRSLKISSGLLVADRLVASALKERRGRGGFITLVHRVQLIIITDKVFSSNVII